MHEPRSNGSTHDEDQRTDPSFVQEHPIAMLMLAIAMLGGATAGYVYLSEALSPVRSILGGALAGFGSWLLVMIGRIIGE